MKAAKLEFDSDGFGDLFDAQTGELVKGFTKAQIPVLLQQRAPAPGLYSCVFDEGLRDLAKMRLPEREINIYLYMISRLDFGNYTAVSNKEIAEELNIAPSNVSRCIQNLCDKGLLLRPEGRRIKSMYALPKNIAWKGSMVDLRKKMQKDVEDAFKIPRHMVD